MEENRDEHIALMEDHALAFHNIYRLCGETKEEIFDLLDKGQEKEALDLCTEKLAINPSDTKLRLLRAFCYQCMGKLLEAEKDLSTVFEQEPDNILVLRARCPTCATKKRYLRHIEDLTRLMDLDPAHKADYQLSRAYRYYWTGDMEAAKQDLCAVKESGVESVLNSADYTYFWNELMAEKEPKKETPESFWLGEETAAWESPASSDKSQDKLLEMIEGYEKKHQVTLPKAYINALIAGENKEENICRDYLDISLYPFEQFMEMQEAFEMDKYCPSYVAVGWGGGGEVLLLEKKADADTLIVTGAGNLVERYITPEYCEFFYDFFESWVKRGCPAKDIDEIYG